MRTGTSSSISMPLERSGLALPDKILRRIAVITLSFLALSGLLFVAFYAYTAWAIAHVPSPAIRSNPMSAEGMPYSNITFHSLPPAGDTLKGWYIPGGSDKTVVFSHGYGGNRTEPWVPILALANAVHSQHYNVIMFDYGYVDHHRPFSGGVLEAQDLLGAVRYARRRGARQVYVWGFSMGAGTALQAALYKNAGIDGMILDSTFVPEPATVYRNLKRIYHLPPDPSEWMLNRMLPVVDGIHWGKIPYRQMLHTNYPMPLFLIHGMKDQKAPYPLAEEIAANQTNPYSKLWLSPNNIHELIYRGHPKVYLARTLEFLHRISAFGGNKPILAAGRQLPQA